jgi:hypothetical protein
MIIHDFDIVHIAVFPSEANPPLIVDTNAVLPLPVAFQRFELIAGRLPEVLKGSGAMQIEQLAPRLPFKGLKADNTTIIKKSGGVATSERLDHMRTIIRFT